MSVHNKRQKMFALFTIARKTKNKTRNSSEITKKALNNVVIMSINVSNIQNLT